jgi:hypothetical protein
MAQEFDSEPTIFQRHRLGRAEALMKRRVPSAVFAAVLQAVSLGAYAQGRACALVTSAEVEAALGIKPAFNGKVLPTGVEVCNSTAGPAMVLIRLFKRTEDAPGKREQDAIDMIKKAGATVEVKKSGPIGCMTIAPGGQSAGQSFSTSCTVAKPPMFAVIEIMSLKERTAIDRLLPLAEKMMARL